MKNINNFSFKLFFTTFGKSLALILFCLVTSFSLVFPFWFFADKAPKVYSVFISLLIVALILVSIVLSVVKKFRGKTTDEKKVLLHNFFRSFLIFFLCLISIVVPFFLILSYYRIASLIVFVVGFICVILASLFIKKY